jgi:hypothetical protein
MFAAAARIRRLQLGAEKPLTAEDAKKIRKGRRENQRTIVGETRGLRIKGRLRNYDNAF